MKMDKTNDSFRWLSMDKASRNDFINSNPLLKKYSNTTKRKPKRLDSSLAKKLEDSRHELTDFYYSLGENMDRILELDQFDDYSKMEYLAAYDGICRIPDEQQKNYELSNLYGRIKKAIEFFIGEEEKKTESSNLPIEAQIQKNILLGSEKFKK